MLPYCGILPMFAQKVGRIALTINMMKVEHSGCDGFTYTVERKCIMSLVELVMGNGGAVDDRAIITKKVGVILDRDAQVSEGVSEINNLICSNSCSDKLRSVGGSLDSALFLGKPIQRSLVCKM